MVFNTALWGGSFTAVKAGFRDLPVLGSLGMRMALAFLALYAWARLRQLPLWYGPRANGWLLAAAFFFMWTQLCVYLGVNWTTAGRGAVFFNTQPFFTLFLVPLFVGGERFTVRKLTGTALAFGGVVLLFLERFVGGGSASVIGDLVVLGGAVAWAGQMVILKCFPREVHPVSPILWGALFTLPPAWALHFLTEAGRPWRWTPVAVGSVLYLSFVAVAFSFVCFTWLLLHYPAIRLNAFVFLTPVFGVLFGWLILGEPLSLQQILGVAFVGAGVWLVAYPGRWFLAERPAVTHA